VTDTLEVFATKEEAEAGAASMGQLEAAKTGDEIIISMCLGICNKDFQHSCTACLTLTCSPRSPARRESIH
jgi:hypothetical protein